MQRTKKMAGVLGIWLSLGLIYAPLDGRALEDVQKFCNSTCGIWPKMCATETICRKVCATPLRLRNACRSNKKRQHHGLDSN